MKTFDSLTNNSFHDSETSDQSILKTLSSKDESAMNESLEIDMNHVPDIQIEEDCSLSGRESAEEDLCQGNNDNEQCQDFNENTAEMLYSGNSDEASSLVPASGNFVDLFKHSLFTTSNYEEEQQKDNSKLSAQDVPRDSMPSSSTRYDPNRHKKAKGKNNLKLHKCNLCNFETKTRSTLNRHYLIHSDTKLFKCEQCSYETNYKSHLKPHMQKHTSSEPSFDERSSDVDSFSTCKLEWGVKENRIAVIALFKCRKSRPEIFDLLKPLGISKMFVYRTIKRFKEIQGADDRPRSGRPRTVRTPTVVEAVRERILQNPLRKQNILALEMDVSTRSLSRLVREDLHLRDYCRSTVPLKKGKTTQNSTNVTFETSRQEPEAH